MVSPCRGVGANGSGQEGRPDFSSFQAISTHFRNMIQTEKEGLRHLGRIALPYLILTSLYSGLILGLEEFLGDHIYQFPGQIASVFGLAVAFFLGFRMNSAYDRWWEARKIFGELTNNTRSFVAKVAVYFGNADNLKEAEKEKAAPQARQLVDLIRLFVFQLKSEMHHRPRPDYEPGFEELLRQYRIPMEHKISNALLLAIGRELEQCFHGQARIEKGDLMQHLNRFYDIQGKAERIRNTPFLKIYGAFTRIVVGLYVAFIPFFIGDMDFGSETSGLEILAVPVMALVSSAFLTINKLANLYGEPFSENRTSVPIASICKTLDQNCLEVRQSIC